MNHLCDRTQNGKLDDNRGFSAEALNFGQYDKWHRQFPDARSRLDITINVYSAFDCRSITAI